MAFFVAVTGLAAVGLAVGGLAAIGLAASALGAAGLAAIGNLAWDGGLTAGVAVVMEGFGFGRGVPTGATGGFTEAAGAAIAWVGRGSERGAAGVGTCSGAKSGDFGIAGDVAASTAGLSGSADATPGAGGTGTTLGGMIGGSSRSEMRSGGAACNQPSVEIPNSTTPCSPSASNKASNKRLLSSRLCNVLVMQPAPNV